MTEQELHTLFSSFARLNVLIVGDVMVDAYLWGDAERISPEAPVPVISVTRKEQRPGGAANVALNIRSLGGNVAVASVVGDDSAGKNLIHLFKDNGVGTDVIIQSSQRVTTVKTRIISHQQHMLRVDEEQTGDLSAEDENRLLETIKVYISSNKPDVILFEDYNKGVLTESLIAKIISLANEKSIPTCVDPKKNNFFSYKNVTLFKPNLKELREGLKTDIDKNNDRQIVDAVYELERRIGNKISLITLSERGVFYKSGDEYEILPAHVRNISDVSGAGDTVIAVAALCLAAKLPVKKIAAISNLAGGLVCEYVGVVPVNKEQLLNEAKNELVQ
ncbi:MAG: bifunctional heptose 7-phosphate kinase/heptose 1-phosphate adenyltransferase [Bacteroidota bacterium]